MFFISLVYSVCGREPSFIRNINHIAMMNKASLVENLQTEQDLTKAQAEQVVEGMFDSIVEGSCKG